jgi:hypothetical protein
MRSKLSLFAAICVAALALGTPASAATILQFTQTNSTDFVQATVVGTSPTGTTTLTTVGSAAPTSSIQITSGQLGALAGVNIPGLETFTTPIVGGLPASGDQAFGYSGTIVISAANGSDPNILTAVITNGFLIANSASGAFNAASNSTNGGLPTTVTLTSDNAAVIAAMGGSGSTFTTLGAVALSLVGITPSQSGSGFVSFHAQNTGNFSTVSAVPEPAGFLSAGTAILAGLGCFGWSRRKSSKA